MALDSLTAGPFPDEPGWPRTAPEPDGRRRRVLFLVDASSGIERELLGRWVARNTPPELRDVDWELVDIPPSRRGRRHRTPPRLEAALAADDDPLLAPLRVAWLAPLREGERQARLSDLLRFGDPRDPGRLRQAWVLARHPDRCRIVAGEPAPASDLRRRWREAGGADPGHTTSLPDYVARQAALTLERAERQLRGARYKVPHLVAEGILGRPAFRGELDRLGRELGIPAEGATRRAARYLREIAAAHSPLVIDLTARIVRRLYQMGYDSLQYDRQQLAGVARLAQQHPVVFLPTHKSNLDHMVMQSILYENGLPQNHTAGGINMNFFPIGPLFRRSGVFFIRRSFKDNEIYKHVLRSYIDYLIEKRFSLEWYIEGGRSRSGKLLPPRFGLLAYVVDAFRRGKSDDVYLIPVSIAYDQIREVGTYSAEATGAAKEPESFGWFVKFVRGMRRSYGDIHVRFGEPVSLRGQLGAPNPESTTGPDENALDLQKLAFEVSVRINRVTPITPTSLMTLALLGSGDGALTSEEVRRSLRNVLAYAQARKLPTTTSLEPLEHDEGIRATLAGLEGNGVVTCYDEGPDPVWMIGRDEQLSAAYYRNTIIHFFVTGAIGELSLLRAAEQVPNGNGDDALEAFWDESMALRDLLKFEFFFPEKDSFRRELAQEMSFHDAAWEARLAEGADAIHGLVRSIRPFSSHRTIRPFLETYQVVSENLARHDASEPIDKDPFLSECLGLGRQLLLQRRIHSGASVSKVLFESALKLAGNRGLLEPGAPDLVERRAAFAGEVRDALRRVEAIAALAAARRAGLAGG